MHKISILYSWFVRIILFPFPDIPLIMRFRGFLYSLMMKRCGKNFQVTSSTLLNSLANMEVGDNVYIAYNTVLIGKFFILGDNVLIGPNCVLSGGNHRHDGESFRNLKSIQEVVEISKNCWIGANCSVTAGSFLPESSILAAGAVLTKKMKQGHMVYGGVPAKVISSL